MKIKFENIKIHHFLSFGDAEISLKDRGYTLVSGINKNPKDSAKSNGSGKSSIWSAISYALTGETIQGLSSNIANIHFNDGCYVELTFKIDSTEYTLLRSKDYKKSGSDLKIFINGEDKSGKGIRESEALLKQYLPDLTSDLIGGVIILGQGLPHKFSDNTPSGRKEVLEKLSKSDFMITDIKDRITKRNNELSLAQRKIEDDLLIQKSQVGMYEKQLANLEKELAELLQPTNFDSDIEKYQDTINEIVLNIDKLNSSYTHNRQKEVELNTSLSELLEVRDTKIDVENTHYAEVSTPLNTQINTYRGMIDELKREITKLKSITDTCPTCHQKLPNVEKPSTETQELELAKLENELSATREKLNNINLSHDSKIVEIKDEYTYKSRDITTQVDTLKSLLSHNLNDLNTLNAEKSRNESCLNKLIYDKENLEKNIARVETSIKEITSNFESSNNAISILNEQKEELQSHIEVISKFTTLVKRDFRGYLLTNVIEFINRKAKEYCKYVFESDEIEFKLEGNNINITFCGKTFENLSGGEKQKVDLVLQFSLRDMLCQYLDFSSNILVLDEIFDNLDSVGCNKVLNLISNKLTDVESIFIISHHSDELSIPADDEIIVEKDINGVSRIK